MKYSWIQEVDSAYVVSAKATLVGSNFKEIKGITFTFRYTFIVSFDHMTEYSTN